MKPAPRLLVLDTATETQHLALVLGDAVVARRLPGGALASATLLPALQALMDEAGLGWRDLDAIGWGQGPGAFTGLRTACAVAQGLAVGAGLPLLALDTLAAVAECAHAQAETAGVSPPDAVWAATDARMGEIYAARWTRHAPGHWTATAPVGLYTPGALREAVLAAPAGLAGNALKVHGDVLADLALPAWPEAEPHGLALAALARAAWARGDAADAATALPLYVRDKVAQTQAEREAARRAVSLG